MHEKEGCVSRLRGCVPNRGICPKHPKTWSASCTQLGDIRVQRACNFYSTQYQALLGLYGKLGFAQLLVSPALVLAHE